MNKKFINVRISTSSKSTIKVCRRKNIPETNSSSTHCLTIFSGEIRDSSINPHLSDDRKTLIIDGGMEFGRSKADYNDTYTKLQYASYNILSHPKRKVMFEKVVKDFLGIDNIIYNWYDSERVEMWAEQNPDITFDQCPFVKDSSGNELPEENMIDHESTHLVEEQIFENETTLKDFLFSPNSWLFCGECNTTQPSDIFPSLAETGEGLILSLVPDNMVLYGNDSVDIEILSNFPYNFQFPKLEEVNRANDLDKLWILAPSGWRSIWGDEEQDIDPTMEILSSIWAKKVDGKYYLQIGNIPDDEYNVYVPFISLNIFKYPFTLNFYRRSLFTKDEVIYHIRQHYYRDENELKLPEDPVISINMIPSFNGFKFNEYL